MVCRVSPKQIHWILHLMNTGPKFSATLAMIASYRSWQGVCAPASPPWPSSQAVSWANCYSFFTQSVEADCWFQSLFSWIHPGILEFKWIHHILTINPFSISITSQLMPWFFDGWLKHQRLVYHHEGLWPPCGRDGSSEAEAKAPGPPGADMNGAWDATSCRSVTARLIMVVDKGNDPRIHLIYFILIQVSSIWYF
jgi:hypothetical protein